MNKPSKSTLSALRCMANNAEIRALPDGALAVLRNGTYPIFSANFKNKKAAARWLTRALPGMPYRATFDSDRTIDTAKLAREATIFGEI